ncbi:hypothetical protein COCVIDRAFT_19194 [Bipolaris victoriae FI3]|uniref:Uncharacterized protein n=1 Tax=Bipolaris victoriae (strain FI3) TaxID=930091 RepID=W7EG94_BIPV3|nr:hypothetical protein COCVIDRAFT_19194 [Bipolaris victoriae FI3]
MAGEEVGQGRIKLRQARLAPTQRASAMRRGTREGARTPHVELRRQRQRERGLSSTNGDDARGSTRSGQKRSVLRVQCCHESVWTWLVAGAIGPRRPDGGIWDRHDGERDCGTQASSEASWRALEQEVGRLGRVGGRRAAAAAEEEEEEKGQEQGQGQGAGQGEEGERGREKDGTATAAAAVMVPCIDGPQAVPRTLGRGVWWEHKRAAGSTTKQRAAGGWRSGSKCTTVGRGLVENGESRVECG